MMQNMSPNIYGNKMRFGGALRGASHMLERTTRYRGKAMTKVRRFRFTCVLDFTEYRYATLVTCAFVETF